MGSHLSCMHWSAKGDSAALEVLLCAAGSCPALSVKTVLSTLDFQSFLVNLGKFWILQLPVPVFTVGSLHIWPPLSTCPPASARLPPGDCFPEPSWHDTRHSRRACVLTPCAHLCAHPPVLACLCLLGFLLLAQRLGPALAQAPRNFSAIQGATTTPSSTRSQTPFPVGPLGHPLELSFHLRSLLSHHSWIILYMKLSLLKLLYGFCLLAGPRLIRMSIIFLSWSGAWHHCWISH